MHKNYGNPIGTVLLKSKQTQWKAVVVVLYRDEQTIILRDWPNTKFPKYFLVSKKFDDETWKKAHEFMSTLNTGGIQIGKLNEEIKSDFDEVNSTFMTPQQMQEWYENIVK